MVNQAKLSVHAFKLCLISILIGLGSGLLGMFLVLLLHYVQHLAYGYSPTELISDVDFLTGVSASSAKRRVLVLLCCGILAGWGWWAIYRFGTPLVSIATAIKTGKKMPLLSTACHIMLQIITVGLGSPLGREVAPREAGALFAHFIATKAGLTHQEIKMMLACGAGAGLAAVYNVPLGGAVFAMEVLLGSFRWPILILTLISSATATLISWWGLGNNPTYLIPDLTLSPSLLVWSVVTSPIFGVCAYWFIRIGLDQRQKAPHDGLIIVTCLANFIYIGLLAIYFPILLGNGKSPTQIEFSTPLSMELSAAVLLLRCLITWTTLRSGAQGGLLTPSLANGALMAVVLGNFWSLFWPDSSLEAYAIIGATAFLAAAQCMPLTAIILIFELTRINLGFLSPILLAVSGAFLTHKACEQWFHKPSERH